MRTGAARWIGLLPLLFLAVGIALAAFYPAVNAAPGESGLAALSLLHTGVIGDPYILPTGPTAHVSPVVAFMLASVFRVFGPNTAAARIVLGLISAVLYALSIIVALRLCAQLGGRRARLFGAVLFILCPMFLYDSVVSSRQWDQPLAAFVLMWGWWMVARPATSGLGYDARFGLLAGFGALVSPSMLPSFILAGAVLAWRHQHVSRRLAGAAIALAMVTLCLLPWGIRNQIELGRFILTRSNFPLELAGGNAPGATGISGSGSAFARHPHDSVAAAQQVQQLGEVGFMARQQAIFLNEVRQDPVRFLRLSATRLRLLLVPWPNMTGGYPGIGHAIPALLFALLGVAHVLALIGAAVLWLWRRDRLIYAGVLFTLLPMAPYVLSHINGRYELLVSFTSIAFIAVVLDRLTSKGPAVE